MINTKVVGYVVGAVGFISAVVGLWPVVFPEKPDYEIMLVEDSEKKLIVKKDTPRPREKVVTASSILIDGVDYEFLSGSVVITNNLTMQNGGSIQGDNIFILSTTISGGTINSRKMNGLDGGKIVLASAQVNGTAISANGYNGSNGVDGSDGNNGVNGLAGREGRCDGFGKWRSSATGGKGGNGTHGTEGTNGSRGGNGGHISIFHSAILTNDPTATPGNGGMRGIGGQGGSAGNGGPGGKGCLGIGGTQGRAANGVAGTPGKDGADGKNGSNGNAGNISLRRIAFKAVQKIVKETKDPALIFSKLRAIPLKN